MVSTTALSPGARVLEAMLALPKGDKLKTCIQCGTCSGSCPNAQLMTYPPGQMVAMLRAGMGDRVIASNSPWYCSSCYLCTLRCPQEIPITDFMYSMKNLSMKAGTVADKNTAAMSNIFTDGVRKSGKNSEMSLMIKYLLRTNPLGSIKMAPLGQNLFLKGRMTLTGEKIKDVKGFQAIVDKAMELGGQE
jgi:heterodisulfide reductase subunit C